MNKKHLFLAMLSLFVLANAASAQTLRPQHQAMIKDCTVCHSPANQVAGNPFVTPKDETCLQCHGSYQALAERTKDKVNGEPNPHASHHYGEGIACTACHNEHQPSKVYCNNCHEFKYQVK